MDNIDFDNRILVGYILKKRWLFKPLIPIYINIFFNLNFSLIFYNDAYVAYLNDASISYASSKWFILSSSLVGLISIFCIIYSFFHWRWTINMLISGKKNLFFSKYRKSLLERSTEYKINKQEILNLSLKFELESLFVYFVCYSLCLIINIIFFDKNVLRLFRIWPIVGIIIVLIIFFLCNSPCIYISYLYYEAQSDKFKRSIMFNELEQKAIRKAKISLKYKFDLTTIPKLDSEIN